MHTKGLAIGTIAKMAAMGVLVAGAAFVAPDVYHDMGVPPTVHQIAAEDSATTPATTPDVYHDM